MTTANPLDTLRDAIVANGGKPEDLEIVTKLGVANALARIVRYYIALLGDVYIVTVDYNLPPEKMIAECVCDYVNPNITPANFSITGEGQSNEEIFLLHFDCDMSSAAAIKEMHELGLEPARLEHALAFEKKFPDKQREFSIIFLGSHGLINGYLDVPCLRKGGSKRGLNLRDFYCYWDRYHRFAAVRKKEPGQQPLDSQKVATTSGEASLASGDSMAEAPK